MAARAAKNHRASGGGSSTQTTWDPAKKNSDIILSNGNIDAENNVSSGGSVLSVSGKSTGKFYAECKVLQLSTISHSCGFGLHSGTASLSTFIGGDANGWGTWEQPDVQRIYTNGAVAGSTVGTDSGHVGDIARLAVDLSAGKLWLSFFGQSGFVGGGDPGTGATPTFTFTPGGTFYLGCSPRNGSSSDTTNRNRLELTNPANWANVAPSGFGIWT